MGDTVLKRHRTGHWGDRGACDDRDAAQKGNSEPPEARRHGEGPPWFPHLVSDRQPPELEEEFW